MADRYDVSGKVAFVTGAARGIGAETARQLTAKGARVALVGLEPELLEQRSAELGGAPFFEADVTDLASLEAAAEGTVEQFGGIDIVLANAGVAGGAPLASMDVEQFDKIVEVNLGGVFRTLRATVPHVTQRAGYVLPVASLAAAMHAPMMGAYSATKAGVEALANSLRGEVQHTGTKVGCAYFGFIDTDMVRRGFERDSAKKLEQRLGAAGPSRAVPVSAAGAAIVRAIEHRARHAYAPRWILPLLLARTVFQPLQEAHIARRGVSDLLDEAAREPSELTTVQPDGVGAPSQH